MIRIHLTAEDIAGIKIVDAPDFSDELVRAGYVLANRMWSGRLSAWREHVAQRWEPGIARLFDLYSPSTIPGIFDQVVCSDPAATASAVAATDPARAADYLNDLTRTRGATAFTRALAEGQASAYTTLGRIFEKFQAAAVDPYRRRITAIVATAAARARSRAATSGTDGLLGTLHPLVHWEDSVLSLEAVADADLELNGRTLVLRPSVFSARPGISGDMFADVLVVCYPATDTLLVPDPPGRVPSPCLTALLGPTRAAALVAVNCAPCGLTTGCLAGALGLSAAAASRQASTLRRAGLITTFRDGMTVHHHITRLGSELAEALDVENG